MTFPYTPRTALIVVDVQHDFADPSGSLAVAGGEAVVPVINAEIEAAQAAGGHVFYTQDWHPEQTRSHFERDGGVWPVHCVADTPGAALHPDLVVVGPSVRKGVDGEDGYSGFTTRHPDHGTTNPTELDQLLREAGVTSVVVAGLATDYCVLETALDAVRLGYDTAVLTDAIAAVDLQPGDGDRAIARMADAGVRIVEGEGS
jgi:nicotinamidase/pyrazinamidase